MRVAGLRFAVVIAALALFAPPAMAQNVAERFRGWLERDLWPEARAAGIGRGTFEEAFAGVSPQLDLPDLVMPGRQAATPRRQLQAEFGAPANYFASATVAGVVRGGRARRERNAAVLASVERTTGVPAGILLAIWGRESGFGAAAIPHDALRVLATKAFMSTRREMFRKEVLAALAMMEHHGVVRSAMKSSWAGALGQPQFLPSSFIGHAADGDGDGRRDIWGSAPDTLASIGAYLAAHGWQRGRDWGFEVEVPASLACSLEGPDRGRSFSEWARLGVARVAGRAFPDAELPREGYLLMPAGRLGPAFVVTPNFYVLKEYNESDLYALFVGHAADRMSYGDRPFRASWAPVDRMLRSDVAAIQDALVARGYDVGGADGLPGFRTRRSIGEWQQTAGLPQTCFPSRAVLRALR